MRPEMAILQGLCLVALMTSGTGAEDTGEAAAAKFLKKAEKEGYQMIRKTIQAMWDYETNITEHTGKIRAETAKEASKQRKAEWKELQKFNWTSFKNEDLKRQFKLMSIVGASALSEEQFNEMTELNNEMTTIYAKAKVCEYKNAAKCDLNLDPDLTKIMATSRDPEELKYYWTAWRDETGKKCREPYKRSIILKREEAKVNGYDDPVKYWNNDFESDTFENDVKKLWKQLEPFYKSFHAFVRDKMNKKYGDQIVSKTGPIPAHLLGNMWAQGWNNIKDIVLEQPAQDNEVTREMIKQGYTPLKMARLAEDFFKSINLTAMPDTFWTKSIFERLKDRDMVCHPSAWDFYQNSDVRLKMCASINEEDLDTMHHEMGHIQYFLQYQHQPKVFREGANSGFHEAIGDTIALSVRTNKHMNKLGLKAASVKTKDEIVNDLLETALDKISFLPFGFLIDQYRWEILKGTLPFDQLECGWWKLREKYQGVEPPIDRTEEDFDPAAKYHVAADVPYIRYFVSFVIQFQFYKALCVEAGQYDPKAPDQNVLSECDIYGNAAAGNLLGKVLQMGSSKPWQDAMEVITGQRNMDAGPLMEYFKPLIDWLNEENKRNNVTIGWEHTKRSTCSNE